MKALLVATHEYRTAYDQWASTGHEIHLAAFEAAASRMDRARREAGEAERMARVLDHLE